MTRPKLTFTQAIDFQREHLDQWKTVLKPEVFMKLRAWAISGNRTCANPFDIKRGVDLDNWVHNYALGYEMRADGTLMMMKVEE